MKIVTQCTKCKKVFFIDVDASPPTCCKKQTIEMGEFIPKGTHRTERNQDLVIAAETLKKMRDEYVTAGFTPVEAMNLIQVFLHTTVSTNILRGGRK